MSMWDSKPSKTASLFEIASHMRQQDTQGISYGLFNTCFWCSHRSSSQEKVPESSHSAPRWVVMTHAIASWKAACAFYSLTTPSCWPSTDCVGDLHLYDDFSHGSDCSPACQCWQLICNGMLPLVAQKPPAVQQAAIARNAAACWDMCFFQHVLDLYLVSCTEGLKVFSKSNGIMTESINVDFDIHEWGCPWKRWLCLQQEPFLANIKNELRVRSLRLLCTKCGNIVMPILFALNFAESGTPWYHYCTLSILLHAELETPWCHYATLSILLNPAHSLTPLPAIQKYEVPTDQRQDDDDSALEILAKTVTSLRRRQQVTLRHWIVCFYYVCI
jgi:hypothetical protein